MEAYETSLVKATLSSYGETNGGFDKSMLLRFQGS